MYPSSHLFSPARGLFAQASVWVLFTFLFLPVPLLADGSGAKPVATIRSDRTGNWNQGSTWQGGVVPGAADIVIIEAGDNVSLTDIRTVG
ncbi:MAG: hypothetical protein AAFZ52_17320, partial [Bacteroidota bacterium]